MSSPSPPKPAKVNPFQGMNADPRFYEAQQALGISNPNDADEVARINAYMFEQDRDRYMKDPEFTAAAGQLAQEGRLSMGDKYRYHDHDSYVAWARKEGYNSKEIKDFRNKMQERTGGDSWYGAEGGLEISSGDIAAIQGRQEKNYYDQQSADQQALLDEAYERQKADSEAAAEEQRAFMKEMMDQPVYMPKQQAPPVVQKPLPKQNPILPAPAAPSPMNIAPPPAPELTAANNKMAIVRTPQSTKARSRRATRGTSSLTN